MKEHQIMQEKIEKFSLSEDCQEFFRVNHRQFKAIFDFELKNTFTPLNFQGERSTIALKTLFTFVKEFNICSSIFNIKHAILIYNSVKILIFI